MARSKRFTLGEMLKKYLALQKQNFEQVMITDVVNDLHRIRRDKLIAMEDL